MSVTTHVRRGEHAGAVEFNRSNLAGGTVCGWSLASMSLHFGRGLK